MEAGSALILQSQTNHDMSLLDSDFENNMSKVRHFREDIQEDQISAENAGNNDHKASILNPTFKHLPKLSLLLESDDAAPISLEFDHFKREQGRDENFNYEGDDIEDEEEEDQDGDEADDEEEDEIWDEMEKQECEERVEQEEESFEFDSHR